MNWRCTVCLRNWAPYMCEKGACPSCGSGTRRTNEPVDDDAVEVHKAALAERAARERSEHNHREFDAYMAKRDAARLDAEEADKRRAA